MTPELDLLLSRLEPATRENIDIRLNFCLICTSRVAHLLEDAGVIAGFNRFKTLLEGQRTEDELQTLAAEIEQLANSHQGSRSLDGVGHAAVSASYACAKAIVGRGRQTAEYAAYAMVYGNGGYGATSDPESFLQEYGWQASALRQLLCQSQSTASAA